MANLHSDLITEILLFLPVKPLWHLRCVSKQFCNLIDSPNFKKAHLIKRSMETRTHLKLILKQRDKERLALWNPFTRGCNILPIFRANTNYPPYPMHGGGLGDESSADDYKVVTFSQPVLFGLIYEVWIFSLRTNSWRRLPDFCYTGYVFNFSPGYLANGALHCLLLSARGMDRPGAIVSFDLADEEFSVVKRPDSRTKKPQLSLNVVDGCLCVGLFNNRRKKGEFPERFAYVKLKPAAYSENRENVLLNVDDRNIFWYDLHEKRGETAEILGMASVKELQVCWESLVSLGDDSESDLDMVFS
ncbi:LOW QUALITY PROTEIN: F-box protein CPR1 [Jatropha curcas]|uniref:LOW QUALITY PROTEIN: F-box protein CPR1 n=1 Tax=Jatropha curcas TaxID=180498 RepID=UPI001894F5BD|nr:LOW QUALITY PROTEIN: F-box protein CPR1 [Jatropha curcas]